MSTHAQIAVEHNDNTVSSIYCHFDGYVQDGVGEALVNAVRTLPAAEELIKEGDVRSITYNHGQIDAPSYHTLHGESVNISKFTNLATFFEYAQWQEFNYLFIDGHWMLVNANTSKPVKDLL